MQNSRWFIILCVVFKFGVAQIPAQAAKPPACADRVAEIAEMLSDEPGFVSMRISNRSVWDALAKTKQAETLIEDAVKTASAAIPPVDDSLYKEIYPWERASRLRRDNMLKLVLAECLENKGRFLPRIIEYLDAISSQTTWVNPYHDREFGNLHGRYRSIDLNCGMAARAVSITLDLLKSRLPDATAERAMQALQRLVFDVYLGVCDNPDEYMKRHCGWFFRDNNWNAACHSYVVGAALRVIDDRKERARFIEGAERGIPSYFNSFEDDGFCTEGPSYWSYGFGQFLRLGLAVRLATGGKVDFFAHPKARAAMDYGYGIQMTKGLVPQTGDGSGPPSPKVVALGELVWPDVRTTYSSTVACMDLDLEGCILYAAVRGVSRVKMNAPELTFPERTFFDKAQTLVCRPGRTTQHSISASVKGSHNGVSHNHNDVGVYSVALGKTCMVQDPGNQAYNLDTFGPKRYDSVFRNSYGHNVPLPAGVLQKTGAKYGAKVVSTRFSDDRDTIVLDLSGAYADPRIIELSRSMTYCRDDETVIVEDVAAFTEPSSFETPVTTYGDVIETDRKDEFVVVRKDGGSEKRLYFSVDASGAKWHVKKETFHNDRYGVLVRFAVVLDDTTLKAKVRLRFRPPQEHLEDVASVAAQKVSSLPEMLLIGDSIRIGYCGAVAEALRGKAEVKWPNGNCQSSQSILVSLARWRGLVSSPKVVQFNCGHWDAAHWDGDESALTTVEEYGRNLRKIIRRIRRYWPEAKIVFATTTPMNPSGEQGRNARTTESIMRYNEEAVNVARSEGVEVNDLFGAVEKWPASDYADYCHFNKAAAKRLGDIVARRLAVVAGLKQKGK